MLEKAPAVVVMPPVQPERLVSQYQIHFVWVVYASVSVLDDTAKWLQVRESRRIAELAVGIGRRVWPCWLATLLLDSCERPMAWKTIGNEKVESCSKDFATK